MVQTETLLRYAQRGYKHRQWYASAGKAIRALCLDNGWSFDGFCDVMAILSPRISVGMNWHATLHYCRTLTVPRFIMRTTRAALAHWETTGEIRGRKTGAFAAALKGDRDALVLDVWMARALGVDERKVTRMDNMAAARRRVLRVADVLSCTVAETQAAIWCGVMIDQNIWPSTFERAASGQFTLQRSPTLPMFGD